MRFEVLVPESACKEDDNKEAPFECLKSCWTQ